MKVLVTGATGQLGSKVVKALLDLMPLENIAVSVRNTEKAEALQALGIEVRQGDFDKPETLDSAFKGIDRLLLISTDGDNETRIRQHTNAVRAAERAGVKFIAYTSVTNAAESELFLAPVHQVTEEAIRKTGIPYSFLRNNWYLENEMGSIQGVLAGAPWVTSAGSGKVAWALRQDYAEAAATVLAGKGHENTIYELSGKALTQEDLTIALGNVLGKNVPIKQVTDEGYAEFMKSVGVPDEALPIVVAIQKNIREGSLEIESNDLEIILGRPYTPIEEGLKKMAKGLL